MEMTQEENEKEHAKLWPKELDGIVNTPENLKAAPELCPVCLHPQSFFEINCENY